MTALAPPTVTEHPDLYQRVQASFERQGMMLQLGARLLVVGPGVCVLELPYSDKVTQQQGGFHGGAMGALADIAGGYAALTVAPPGMEVTTVEYKINFLAALRGGRLQATGQVVRAGKRVIVSSATVVHLDEHGNSTDCAMMQQTLMPVAKTY
ncbi:MAG: PaaI family thioesterase [Burkholderiaceae bacterium]